MGSGTQREVHSDGRITIGGRTVAKNVGGSYYGGKFVSGTGSQVQVHHKSPEEAEPVVKAKFVPREKYWFCLQREGRVRQWIDKRGKAREEEVLTVRQCNKFPAGTKLGRSLCYRLMRRYLGLKLKKGEQVAIKVIVGEVRKMGELYVKEEDFG